tara:strand:- start:84 stop:818 length:735 start_codon:yes stop_codon:yes gene_type:complete
MEEILKTGKKYGKKTWLTEESVRAVYDKYTKYFPTIVQNWHPVNGHTQEVADARLKHFMDWFGVDKPPVEAFSEIMQRCSAKKTLISDPMRHLHHTINHYFWWAGGLFGNFPPSHFWPYRYVCRNWNHLIDLVGEQNTVHKKFHVNLNLNVWLELSAQCVANDVEIEKITLLTYRMEELAYTWERELNTDYDAPSGYTNEDFNKWLDSHPYAGTGSLYLEEQEEKWGIMKIRSFEAENSAGFEG